MDGHQDLLFEVREGVAYVTFNRPQARNALNFAMYERLQDVAESIEDDRSIRALLVTGAGEKAFASGTDIGEFRNLTSAEHVLEYEERIDGALGALERCRVPTIAAIAGACTGGGASIAACCDLRIAVRGARFGFPVARTLGNCLSMNNYARLAALIGPAAVKQLVILAELVSAEQAREMGFVTEVVEDYPALQVRAEEVVRKVATHAPLTMQATKEALRRVRPRPEAESSELMLMCYLSEDFREGIDAFLSKRTPVFNGR
jgi:enoyl-CoA hydratase